MTRSDIVAALERLKFRGMLQMDGPVRDLLVSALRRKASRAVTGRRFPPPWSVEELDACFVVARRQRPAPTSISGKSRAAIRHPRRHPKGKVAE
jgi:hypothetical protein